tara:strand:+ start:256 stop:639 length:384 start_codon:yes stop_codon:yes gene_type:complete
MYIYKIVINDKYRFVGSTVRSIKRKRFGHKVCAKNLSTCCTLYKKIRELDIEPTIIDLEVLEKFNKGEDMTNRLIYWKKKEDSNLDECRAHLYIDGKTIIKKTNMCCECNNIPIHLTKGKPFLLTFD